MEENDVNSRRGPRRGLRGIGEDARRGKGRMRRKAREGVGEGWVREEAGERSGERSGEEAGRKGAGGGAELGLGLGLGRGLARRARRGGTRRASGLDRSAGYRGVLGRRWEFVVRCQCTRARWQRSRSIRDVASPRECSTREGSQSSSSSLSGDARRGCWGRREVWRRGRRAGCRGVRGRLREVPANCRSPRARQCSASIVVSGPRERSPRKRSQSGRRSLGGAVVKLVERGPCARGERGGGAGDSSVGWRGRARKE